MFNAFSNAGISIIDSSLSPRWGEEWKDIIDVIKANCPEIDNYTEITPAQHIFSLRNDIRSAAPGLADFSDHIKEKIKMAGCGVFIPELSLSNFDENTRSYLIYALAVCLGEPTQTDNQYRRVIWDVKPRLIEQGYFATFSEHDQEAGFHTDTQYYPNPEKYFLLYVIKSARCKGGLSSVCNARALLHKLEAKNKQWIIDLLTHQPLPFRIPSAFLIDTKNNKIVQATVAPIFSDSPFIRYRRDTLLDGLRYFPEYSDPDTMEALHAFDSELRNKDVSVDFLMPDDSFIFINNHNALHARTAFMDQSRHLLRIRLHDGEKNKNKYDMVSMEIN